MYLIVTKHERNIIILSVFIKLFYSVYYLLDTAYNFKAFLMDFVMKFLKYKDSQRKYSGKKGDGFSISTLI